MKEADYDEINYMFLVVILIIAINYLLLPIFNMNTLVIPSSSTYSNNVYTSIVFLYWLIRLVKAIESK